MGVFTSLGMFIHLNGMKNEPFSYFIGASVFTENSLTINREKGVYISILGVRYTDKAGYLSFSIGP